MKKVRFPFLVSIVALSLFAACPSGQAIAPAELEHCVMSGFRFEVADNPGVLAADAVARPGPEGSVLLVGPLPEGTGTGALVARYELSPGARASVDGIVQESGRTPNDFGGEVRYRVFEESGREAFYAVRLSVAEPGEAARLSSFSVAVDGIGRRCRIEEDGDVSSIFIPLSSTEEPPSAAVAQFSLSDPRARLMLGDAIQESGTTANDFREGIELRVLLDGARERRYLVRFQANPVLCSFTAFCPSGASIYAEGGMPWTDLALVDSGGLGPRWRLMAASGGGVGVILESADLSQAALADGSRLRVHGPSWQELDAASPAEHGDPSLWDVAARADAFGNAPGGLLWVENSIGMIVEALAWRRGGGGSWLSGEALAALERVVVALQWPSAVPGDAFTLDEPERSTGRLLSILSGASVDGNAAAHWEASQGPFARVAEGWAEPPWIQVTVDRGADVRLRARLETLGAVQSLAVFADLSSIGGPAAVPLRDDGCGSDEAAGDDIWSASWPLEPLIVEEGLRRFAVRAVLSPPAPQPLGAEASFVLSPLPPPAPKALLPGGDMETDLDLVVKHAILAYETTTGADGSPTRALHVAGTLGANATVLLSAAPCAARTLGFGRVSFLIKACPGGIPKAINLEFGTATTAILSGQLFRLVSEWHGDASFAPSGSGFLYAATPGSDSGGAWVKASLDCSGTDTARPLLLRLGSGSYDFWIDELVIEP